LTRALSKKDTSSSSSKMLAGNLHGNMVAAVVEENTFRHRDGVVVVGKLGKMAATSMVHSEEWVKAYMVPEEMAHDDNTRVLDVVQSIVAAVPSNNPHQAQH